MKSKVLSKTILVVDDDREFLEELADFLHTSGYNAVAISDPLEGVKAVVQIKPDLILLDLKMPAKSGFELANDIRGLPEFSAVPIIAMSAFVRDESASFLSICGINKYIKKPFHPAQLVEDIEKILGHCLCLLKIKC